MDYKKSRALHAAINIDRTQVERVESLKFFGFHITNKLSWSKHTKTVVKRAQQHIFPLRRLKRFGNGPQILKVPQLLHRKHPDRKAVQRVVSTAQYITGAELPAIQGLY